MAKLSRNECNKVALKTIDDESVVRVTLNHARLTSIAGILDHTHPRQKSPYHHLHCCKHLHPQFEGPRGGGMVRSKARSPPERYATAAKNLYNPGYFVGGYNMLLRIEWCGCSMLIARAFKYERCM